MSVCLPFVVDLFNTVKLNHRSTSGWCGIHLSSLQELTWPTFWLSQEGQVAIRPAHPPPVALWSVLKLLAVYLTTGLTPWWQVKLILLDMEDGAIHRLACGIHKESLELHKLGTLSSVSRKVVRVQVVVTCALWQAVVPVQIGLWLVHWFQVVVRLVGFSLENAGGSKKGKCWEVRWWSLASD